MSGDFDDRWASTVVAQLAGKGVEFAEGLRDDDIARIGEVFNVLVPDELAQFLRAGVPISPKWTRWSDGAEAVRDETDAWLRRAFSFDIEHANYWHNLLGERPLDLSEAIAQAHKFLRTAPALIPIFAHRFITTSTTDGTQAVLSVYQAYDSIYYGNDLADYFAREFGVSRPAWATTNPPTVPVWGQLFDLLGAEGTDEP
jgi:hypothetical protein